MASLEDLVIPRSALTFQSTSEASADISQLSPAQLAGLLEAVVEHHARSLLEAGALSTVSITTDMSGESEISGALQFASRIDRKTRTLIFASGVAKQNDRHLLKATVVFRIH